MTNQEDPELERRLRRIAEPPRPKAPLALLARLDELATAQQAGKQQRILGRPSAHLASRRSSTAGLTLALAAIVVLVVALVSFSLVTRPGPVAGSPSTSSSATATVETEPTARPSSTPVVTPAQPTPLVQDFTTAGSLGPWTTFSWGDFAPGHLSGTSDGLGVGQVFRWSGGYVATGGAQRLGWPSNTEQLWTSTDGETWRVVKSIDASAIFVTAAPAGLVAIGLGVIDADGNLGPTSVWSSKDGLDWHYDGVPHLLGQQLVSVAGTSSGIVATTMSSTPAAKGTTDTYHVEFSEDGISWTEERISAGISAAETGAEFAPHVQTNNGHFYLMGSHRLTASGEFRLLGSLIVDEMWLSDDGQHWRQSRGGYQLPAYWIEFGRDGMLLHTSSMGTPGGSGLAYSTNGGLTWTESRNAAPLGWAPCSGECSTGPDGVIGSNGTLIVAVKNGGKQAWTSYDGKTWKPIQWLGPDPAASDYQFLVMPRGVAIGSLYGAGE